MGRTLHYSIEKKVGVFSRANKQALIDVAEKYNNGAFDDIWSCENYYFTPFNYFPNWDKKSTWEKITKEWKKLEASGLKQIDIYDALFKAGLILYHCNPSANKYNGFTKVQGNEFNAFLVLRALVEVSKNIPKAIIKLSDEGSFLYCDLQIKNGLARPMLSDIRDTIKYYALAFVPLDKLDFQGLPDSFKSDIFSGGRDGVSYVQYINNKLRDLSQIYARIKHLVKADYHCIFNIEQEWFHPSLLHRRIKPEDFADVKCNVKSLMAGFYGEYYGLSDKDAELESLKMAGQFKKLTDGAGLKMEILKKI